MADELYSVTFDFMSKGGTPLVMQSPPLGAGFGAGAGAGFGAGVGAGKGGRGGRGGKSGGLGTIIGAAVVKGIMGGFAKNKLKRALIKNQVLAARNQTLRYRMRELKRDNNIQRERAGRSRNKVEDLRERRDVLKGQRDDANDGQDKAIKAYDDLIENNRKRNMPNKVNLPKPELGVLKVTKLEIEKAVSSTPAGYVTPAASSAGTASKTFEATVKLLTPSRSSGITETTKQLIDTSRQNNIVDAGETQ